MTFFNQKKLKLLIRATKFLWTIFCQDWPIVFETIGKSEIQVWSQTTRNTKEVQRITWFKKVLENSRMLKNYRNCNIFYQNMVLKKLNISLWSLKSLPKCKIGRIIFSKLIAHTVRISYYGFVIFFSWTWEAARFTEAQHFCLLIGFLRNSLFYII